MPAARSVWSSARPPSRAGGGACCDGGGTLTRLFNRIHQAKAAYRLLDCDTVTHQSVLDARFNVVRERLTEPGVYLLIEDSTTAGFPGLARTSGPGPISESSTRGFWLHSTLALPVA